MYPAFTLPFPRQAISVWSGAFAALLWLVPQIELLAETSEGFTEPYVLVDLAIPEPGIISEVNVAVGDLVKRGQLIASLDYDVLLKGLAIAKLRAASTGQVEAARAEVQLRQDRLMQLRELLQRGSASKQETTRAETDLLIGESRLRLAEEEQQLNLLEVERMQAQIDRRIIRSPIDGVVSEIHKEVGESYIASDPRIVTVVQLDRLKAKFSVSPAVAVGFHIGDTSHVSFPDASQSAIARIENIAPIIDAKSGTVEVTLVIDNRPKSHRSGTRCVLSLNDGPRDHATIQTQQNAGPTDVR